MTIGRSYCIVIQVLRKHDAAVAQSVERRIGSAEVTGPIPVSSSFLCQKSLSDNLILFWLFFFLTGNKMINEKIDRMLLCLDDFWNVSFSFARRVISASLFIFIFLFTPFKSIHHICFMLKNIP